MGKGQCRAGGSKTYVLKLDMHCQCNGCVKKIKDGVKEMNLSQVSGVERADVSAEMEDVTVRVTGAVGMEPEKLCCLLQEATRKCVTIVLEEESLLPQGPGRIARPGQTKDTYQSNQVPSDWVAPPEAAGGWWWRHGAGKFPATAPSAPPLPVPEEEGEAAAWSETTAPSERCRYRWAAPGSTLAVWADSEITGTLAMYEL